MDFMWRLLTRYTPGIYPQSECATMHSTTLFKQLLALTACLMCLAINPAQAATCDSQPTNAVTSWFKSYTQAWVALDAPAASALYSRDATYQEDPFESPMRGAGQIRQYWDDVARGQRDVKATYEVLSSCGDLSIVHWHASFSRVPSGQRVELDGIAEVMLDKMGKCIRFREWWDRKQS